MRSLSSISQEIQDNQFFIEEWLGSGLKCLMKQDSDNYDKILHDDLMKLNKVVALLDEAYNTLCDTHEYNIIKP